MYGIVLECEGMSLVKKEEIHYPSEFEQADGKFVYQAIFSEYRDGKHLGDYSFPINTTILHEKNDLLMEFLDTVSKRCPTLEDLAALGDAHNAIVEDGQRLTLEEKLMLAKIFHPTEEQAPGVELTGP